MKNNTRTVLKRFQNFRYGLILQGVVVGAIAGLVSVLFRIVIEHANDLLFLVLDYANQQMIVKIAWFAALAVLAALAARLVRWQPMIGGSGIPQVEGELHGVFSQSWWRVLLAKFAGGAISIGAGLSLGREGPSIQLGAMAGKGFSRVSKRIKIVERGQNIDRTAGTLRHADLHEKNKPGRVAGKQPDRGGEKGKP